MLILLTVWINSLSVLVRDRSSPSYFSRKLLEFGAYANYLDHLDCSHGVLGVFYNKIFISESKFLSPSMKTIIRTYACAFSHDHLDFSLLCVAHIATRIRMNSLSVLFETEVHLPILRGSCSNLELMRILLIIWIAVMVYWQYFIRKNFFQKAIFSPHL